MISSSSQQGNKQELSREKTMQQELKSDDPSRILKPLQGVVLSEGFLPIGSILAGQGQRGFFIHRLNQVFYPPKNDALTHLFQMVNSKDIFLLGAVNYEQQNWVTIVVQFLQITNIMVNPSWSGFIRVEEDEDGKQLKTINDTDFMHFYVKGSINYSMIDGTLNEMATWDSDIYQKLYGDIAKSKDGMLEFNFDQIGLLSMMHIFSDEVQSIFCQIKFFVEFHSKTILLGEKFIPLTTVVNSQQNGSMKSNIDYPSNDDPFILFKQQQPQIKLNIIISNESPQQAESMIINSGKVVKVEEEVQDFRKSSFLVILCDILNCGLPLVMIRGLEELNEFLLYSRPESYDQYTMQLIQSLTAIINVFNDNKKIILLALQALYQVVGTTTQQGLFVIQDLKVHMILMELVYLAFRDYQLENSKLFSTFKIQYILSTEQILSVDISEQLPSLQIDYFVTRQTSLDFITNFLSYKKHKMLDNIVLDDEHPEEQLLDYELTRCQGKIVLFCINILDLYMSGDITHTLEMSTHFPLIIQAYRVYDPHVDNMATHFCYLINNLINLYGEIDISNYVDKEDDPNKEDVKNIDLEEFPRLLKVLLNNVKVATQIEYNSIIKTCHNLVGFMRNKGTFLSIQDLIPDYINALLSQMNMNFDHKIDLDQHLSIFLDEIVSLIDLDGCQAQIVSIFKSQPILPIFAQIIQDELKNIREENDEAQDTQYILKNSLDILTYAIRDFGLSEDLSKMTKFLRDRIKAIKNSRKQLVIEQFLQFLQQRSEMVLKKQDLKHNKVQVTKELKAKIDFKAKQKALATKYMISKVDW